MVTQETTQFTVISRGGKAVEARCRECCGYVQMVGLEEAIVLTGASSREIHRLLEADAIHFSETSEGFVLICLNSLQKEKSHV